jgi:CheY-like chemotaxis protein
LYGIARFGYSFCDWTAGRHAHVARPRRRFGGQPMDKLRVLIVEDNGLIADLLAELIEAFGHKVCAIESTESGAIAAAGKLKPDLMIVDAYLEKGSGIVAVDTITRSGHIPHIFVTGDATVVRTLKPTATVLQKPYFELDLVLAIKLALEANKSLV